MQAAVETVAHHVADENLEKEVLRLVCKGFYVLMLSKLDDNQFLLEQRHQRSFRRQVGSLPLLVQIVDDYLQLKHAVFVHASAADALDEYLRQERLRRMQTQGEA